MKRNSRNIVVQKPPKSFNSGDHVVIIKEGRFHGKVGNIVGAYQVQGRYIVRFPDKTQQEFGWNEIQSTSSAKPTKRRYYYAIN